MIDRAGNAARSVGGYISNLAREVRDVPTAIGTGLWSSFDRQNAGPGNLQKTVDNSTRAGWNTRAQVKDVFQAIGGQSGNRSDQYNAKGNYVSGSKLKK
jgi:hypothetical protein